MSKGDIIVVFEDSPDNGTVYLSYDRNLLIGISSFGRLKLLSSEDFSPERLAIYTLRQDITRARRKRLGDVLVDLITGRTRLSFKQRRNFTSFIHSLYKDIIGISLVEYPLPVTNKNIVKSIHLTRIQ